MIITTNPTQHSTESDNYLIECCGLLAHWVGECPEDTDLKQYLTESYGFGDLLEMSKAGHVAKDGVYSYPNDPALHPFMRFERQQETVYIYAYGIVAICYKDARPDFITRMD